MRETDRVQIAPKAQTLDEMIQHREAFLTDYQDSKLAARYTHLVNQVRQREQAIGSGDTLPLTEAVARQYFKTLAYKDEYEVARLHTATPFLKQLKADYGNGIKVRFHLAPPVLNGKLDARGRPRKKEFGSWMVPVFRVLASMRRLRGTWLDPFGKTAERRMERQLITELEQTVDNLLTGLTADNLPVATAIVQLFGEIRGYGPVKEEAVHKVRQQLEAKLADFHSVTSRAA